MILGVVSAAFCCHSQRSGRGRGTVGATGRCRTPVQQQRTRSSRQRRRCRRRGRPSSLATYWKRREKTTQEVLETRGNSAHHLNRATILLGAHAIAKPDTACGAFLVSGEPHVQNVADGGRLTTLLPKIQKSTYHRITVIEYSKYHFNGRPVVRISTMVFRVRLRGEGGLWLAHAPKSESVSTINNDVEALGNDTYLNEKR